MAVEQADMTKSKSESILVWQWIPLLHLDVPLVAVAWQGFIGAYWEVPLSWADRLVLALVVWLLLTTKSWLDAVRGESELLHHRFYQRHLTGIRWLLVVVSLLSGILALFFLSGWVLVFGGVLLGVIGVFFYSLQDASTDGGELKPLIGGILFSLGCMVVPFAKADSFTLWLLFLLIALAYTAFVCFFLGEWWQERERHPLESLKEEQRPAFWGLFYVGLYGLFGIQSIGNLLYQMLAEYSDIPLVELLIFGFLSMALWVPIITVYLLCACCSFQDLKQPPLAMRLRLNFIVFLPAAIGWLLVGYSPPSPFGY